MSDVGLLHAAQCLGQGPIPEVGIDDRITLGWDGVEISSFTTFPLNFSFLFFRSVVLAFSVFRITPFFQFFLPLSFCLPCVCSGCLFLCGLSGDVLFGVQRKVRRVLSVCMVCCSVCSAG